MSRLLTTGEIVERRRREEPPALFRLAFRPFFLLGALFSIINLALWAGVFTGSLDLTVYGGPLWWHAHEMLFGFVSAIIVGFLLTAVRTWTGQPGIQGTWLACLVILWLSGRLVLFFPSALPAWLTALTDLAFLPMAALVLARPVVRVKQWRNIIFVPLLLAMTASNGVMHWSAHTGNMALQTQASNAMVMFVTLLMTVMAGRVLPMFTANGTGTEKVTAVGWLEKMALATLLLAVITSFQFPGIPAIATSLCFILAAFIHSVRAFRWRIWVTFRTPLVWSLHLSYWCIPLGLLLYGLSDISSTVTRSQAIHTLTVGAMGMMILAMISRVSLGHTGRAIRVGKVMAGAFAFLFGAFLMRVFGAVWIDNYAHQIIATAALWSVGYGCFVVLYLPILTQPRVDGQPG
ncbi:NnrS family protein [Pseudohalioglobus lutimaris]|uniref:NnrS family protein n=1 Tax=Pseudohalioglobus lutimaris TaxID=1737061 RepID=A0A2N5X519_9GAMM|nr:NnrS family protein [Pseudohalioglobus lutimaris]PLW69573.1 NnrS family protein [Pseudohalioglobus lutimaris]